MRKRPGAETNGQGDSNGDGNGNGHSNGNGNGRKQANGRRLDLRVEPLRRQSGKISVRQTSPFLPAFLILALVALTSVVLTITAQDPLPLIPHPSVVPRAAAFRLAVNRAISAAEVTQTASSQEEWNTIAAWWREAVDLMKMVPDSSPNYAVAQSRIPEYERNLSYAQQKAGQAPISSFSRGLWSKDLRRADVIRIQGIPTQTERYDALCKELLHFGSSTVELNNGIVVHYEDLDRNLRAASGKLPIVVTGDEDTWTLDVLKDQVFKIQGTPSRIVRYDSSQKDVLYYGNSLVYLNEDRVTGYDNIGNNLKVAVAPSGTSNSPMTSWTLDSPRDDIFKVQGTPTQVTLDPSSCSESLQYGDSTIELHNGFVSAYNDLSGNLRVRVK